jgi:hypothetical protein
MGFNLKLRMLNLHFILGSMFILLTLGCGSPPDPAVKPVPNTNSNTPPPERAISGVYNVSGAMGTDEYSGILTITNQVDAYNFRWMTNQGGRIGVGIQIENTAAVSFARLGGGDGCGVVLFKIASDGGLNGRTARWGQYRFGTEAAVRTKGDRFIGEYSVSGTDPEGDEYKGTLAIKKNGEGYDFEWRTPKPVIGFGIWKGSHAAVSVGGTQCSFAVYDILANGNLEGNWGGQRSVMLGTESAKLQ